MTVTVNTRDHSMSPIPPTNNADVAPAANPANPPTLQDVTNASRYLNQITASFGMGLGTSHSVVADGTY